jgi:hypothetical protein
MLAACVKCIGRRLPSGLICCMGPRAYRLTRKRETSSRCGCRRSVSSRDYAFDPGLNPDYIEGQARMASSAHLVRRARSMSSRRCRLCASPAGINSLTPASRRCAGSVQKRRLRRCVAPPVDAPRTCRGAFAPRSRGDGGTAQRQDASRSGLEPFRSKIGVYPSSPSKNLKGSNLVMERSCPAGVYRESRIAYLVECGKRDAGAGK